MNALVTVKDLNKQFSTKTLFRGLSLVISENEKMGIVGPNGAGKSTFFKILAGLEEADDGQLIFKRGLQIAYVPQTADFDLSKTALELAREVARSVTQSEIEELALANSCILEMRLKEIDKPIEGFSGGEKKRLQIALGLCKNPQLLLLDEPTNHLDIGSIHELESILKQSSYAWAMISHDRSFLENTVNNMSEINPRYVNGIFTCSGNYSNYRRRREEFLEAEAKQRDSLESKVRMEEAWLRQGARARSTKAKGRINSANALIEDLAETKERQKEEKIKLSFTSSERKTKELAEFHKVSKGFDGKEIFSKLSLKITRGQALGILGLNGTGKSTFVKLLTGEIEPDSGTVKQAQNLKISHFRQFDNEIDSDIRLKNYLAVEGDSVVFRGNLIHVASWAKRFKFPFEQLVQPMSSLSGGEKARARIARLMLETPDILILDEPTNDLDIETLEVLEQSLAEFSGAVILVTHDRYLINNICNSFLGLGGKNGATLYADYAQWERDVFSESSEEKSSKEVKVKAHAKKNEKKLTNEERRELGKIENTILKAEKQVEILEGKVGQEEIQADNKAFQEVCLELSNANKKVQELYLRWEELEKKNSG